MGFLVGECGKYMGIGRNQSGGYHSSQANSNRSNGRDGFCVL